MGFVGDVIGDITGSNDAADAAGDASDAQLQATRESNELLEKMWNQSRDDLAPWRNAGGAALNRLLGLTGLPQGAAGGGGGGGGGTLTEAQLREQLLPQFTTTTPGSTGNPPSLRDLGWRGSYNNAIWSYDPNQQKWGYQVTASRGGDMDERYTTWRYADDYQPNPTSTVDETGLTAEIQKRLAAQQAANAGGGTTQQPSMQEIFESDPGYQFRLDQGQQALDRQLAARGSLLSGRAAKDTASFSQGLASQEFGNAWNRLANIAGVGQQAVNQTSQLGSSYGNQMAGNIIQGGNARASGYIAQGQQGANNFNSLLNAGGTAASLWAAFSDRRLKKNIRRIGTHASGLPWYEFDYVWGEHSQGVMADEAREIRPEAVGVHPSGYLTVNYEAL